MKTILIALIAVGALGGVGYLLTTSLSGEGAPTVATTTAATTTETTATLSPREKVTKIVTAPPVSKSVGQAKVTGIGPLSYLFSLKEPLVCSVKTTVGYARTGTMYVAGGKMRVNFATASMIDDGAYLYVWTNGADKGLKLLAGASASGSAAASNGGFDITNDLVYSCAAWAENTSIFTPAAGVSFSNTL